MVDHLMQQMMEELSRSGSANLESLPNINSSGDLSTTRIRERNILDALENMKMLQDLTITTGQMQHTKIDSQDGDGGKNIVDEAVLTNLKDIELKSLIDKRFGELNAAEKVVLTLHMINQQVTGIDNIVQKVLSDQEKDFLNTYSGHMKFVM